MNSESGSAVPQPRTSAAVALHFVLLGEAGFIPAKPLRGKRVILTRGSWGKPGFPHVREPAVPPVLFSRARRLRLRHQLTSAPKTITFAIRYIQTSRITGPPSACRT